MRVVKPSTGLDEAVATRCRGLLSSDNPLRIGNQYGSLRALGLILVSMEQKEANQMTLSSGTLQTGSEEGSGRRPDRPPHPRSRSCLEPSDSQVGSVECGAAITLRFMSGSLAGTGGAWSSQPLPIQQTLESSDSVISLQFSGQRTKMKGRPCRNRACAPTAGRL